MSRRVVGTDGGSFDSRLMVVTSGMIPGCWMGRGFRVFQVQFVETCTFSKLLNINKDLLLSSTRLSQL